MTEDQERAAVANLPSLGSARGTKVIHIPKFLSNDEILALHVAIEKIQADGAGRLYRDADGMQHVASAPWETTYLHTAGGFPRECRPLQEKILELARKVDEEQEWGLLSGQPLRQGGILSTNSSTSTEKLAQVSQQQEAELPMGPLNFRTIEYHEVSSGGALPNPDHFDGGSLITIDILLTEKSSNFTGGDFVTSEPDGQMKEYPAFCNQGDALVFVSHKRHSVRPVTSGRRAVLVSELWHGTACDCAHRCTLRDGSCRYSTSFAAASLMLTGQAEPDNIASAY